jgi:hypothetical protein
LAEIASVDQVKTTARAIHPTRQNAGGAKYKGTAASTA